MICFHFDSVHGFLSIYINSAIQYVSRLIPRSYQIEMQTVSTEDTSATNSVVSLKYPMNIRIIVLVNVILFDIIMRLSCALPFAFNWIIIVFLLSISTSILVNFIRASDLMAKNIPLWVLACFFSLNRMEMHREITMYISY